MVPFVIDKASSYGLYSMGKGEGGLIEQKILPTNIFFILCMSSILVLLSLLLSVYFLKVP